MKDYPDITPGSILAREAREICNNLSMEEKARLFDLGRSIIDHKRDFYDIYIKHQIYDKFATDDITVILGSCDGNVQFIAVHVYNVPAQEVKLVQNLICELDERIQGSGFNLVPMVVNRATTKKYYKEYYVK